MEVATINRGRTLKNIDNELINTYGQLPVDFWDFKDWDVRENVHGLHNYPATMVYPITKTILQTHQKFEENMSVFLDPFMGSGTGVVEAYLAGFTTVFGTDLNPLARLMARVKTNPIEPTHLSQSIALLLKRIERSLNEQSDLISGFDDYVTRELDLDITARDGWGKNAQQIAKMYLSKNNMHMDFPNVSNLGYWFKPVAVLKLQLIKDHIREVSDSTVKNFFWLTFSEVARLCSNTRNSEFKMFRMKREVVEKFNPDVFRTFVDSLSKNEEKMKAYWELCKAKLGSTEIGIFADDARFLESIPDNSVDIVVTSPPYGDSKTTVAYGQFSRTSLEWLDMDDTYEGERKLSQKDIRQLDNELLGGRADTKSEFKYDLDSLTLKNLLSQIKYLDEKRAREVYQFYMDIDVSLGAITKKTRENSYQYWVVGNRTVKGVKLLTHRILIELATKYGLRQVTTLNRAIPNKVMPHQNSPSNKAGEVVPTMTDEHIVVFRKGH